MSRLPIRISVEAEAEIEDSYAYIEANNPSVAERFEEAVSQAFERISEHPAIGAECTILARIAPDIRRWVVRSFPNYLILYRVTTERVEIVAFLHGARDLEEVFARGRLASLEDS